MNVEVAEVDQSGIRETVHEFSGVVGLTHKNNKVHISFESGTETLNGNGGRLEVVSAELE